MKTTLKFQRLVLFAAFGSLLTLAGASCSKDAVTPTPTPTPNIVKLAQSDTSLSILVSCVSKAGLVDALSNTQNLTVFAPTNAAFRAAGYPQSVIDMLTPAQITTVLTPILTYHVLGIKVLSTAVPVSDTVKTLNGKNIFASKNPNGVFVNGKKVTTADLIASNGVVHIINGVMVPPTQTITEIVVGNPNFSLLKTAVVHAGLAGALGGPGKFTVFAPVNAGFPASLDTDAEINAAPAATVAGVVTSHAFATNIFASDLVAGNTGATVNPLTTLTVGLSPASVKITGSANPVSNITATDIVATNGVIHVIDKVLQ
jgi:uncharacterized surface protein with fasciclin (FAS1) repeats